MLIDLDGKPGSTLPFEITLYSTTKNKKAKVNLTFSDPIQQLSGSMDFKKPGASSYSCLEWIELEEHELIVPAGGERILKGKMKIPHSANGTRLATIMVNQSGTVKKGEVNMAVRYAVFIRLNIEGRKIQGKAKIENFEQISDLEGNKLQAIVSNNSSISLPLKGKATIQDSSRRVVSRFELFSKSAIKRKENFSNIYPGGKVALTAAFEKPLPPGEYTANIEIKGEKRRYDRKTYTFTINSEDVPASIANQTGFMMEPTMVDFRLPAGAAKGTALTLTNNSKELSETTLTLEKVASAPSCLDWLSLSKNKVKLAPGKITRIPLRLKVPKGTAPGGYYAKVVTKDTKGETNSSLVAVVVKGESKAELEVQSFAYAGQEESIGDFVVQLTNKGSVHAMPQGEVVITDADKKEIEKFSVGNLNRPVLPGTSSEVSGKGKRKLAAGNYIAKVMISYAGGDPLEKTLEFTVQ